MTDELIIGMLSGTSRDGVDAVLVNFNNDSMDILHGLCTPYPPAIKKTLDQLLETGAPPGQKVADLLDENLAFFFARVAQLIGPTYVVGDYRRRFIDELLRTNSYAFGIRKSKSGLTTKLHISRSRTMRRKCGST